MSIRCFSGCIVEKCYNVALVGKKLFYCKELSCQNGKMYERSRAYDSLFVIFVSAFPAFSGL